MLLVAYTSAQRNAARIGGQLRALLVSAPDPIRVDFAGLGTPAIAAKAARLRPGPDPADLACATRTSLRTLARQYLTLTADAAGLEADLDRLTVRANPGLRQVHGVGPIVAAQLLTTAGDNPDRLTSDAAFAALCGVSPVPASSGKTTAVRLNRAGDRQANCALHRIVLARIAAAHQPTIDYLAKRTAQGMPRRSIIRCLKRYVAREIHSHLIHPKPAVQTDDLRTRRQAIQQPLHVVADALASTPQTISRLERGTNHNPDLARRYRTWIHQQETAS